MSATIASTRRSEFSGHKLLVASAAIGLTTSMNAVMFYSLGSFIGPLQAEFGWDRASISFATTLLTFGIFLSGPVVGQLCDRFGAAAVGSLSLVAFALATITMTATVDSLPGFWLAYFVIAILGVGSTPIVLVRPITAGFDKRRGLALGIALTGAGLAGFWVPNVVTAVTSELGWRAGYVVLAAAAIAAAPLVWFGFRPSERRAAVAAVGSKPVSGVSFGEARRTLAFWLVSAFALTIALGIGGMIVHLIPAFRDLGADAATAAGLASIIGLSSAIGRIGIGLCLDRFPAPLVSVVVLVLGMTGIALLNFGGLPFAIFAVVLIGLLLGAELDLLAYLTSRLFGQRAFGAIYGWVYSVFSIGFGVSPFLMGGVRDRLGSYDVAMIGSVAFLGIAAMVVLAIGATLRRDDARP